MKCNIFMRWNSKLQNCTNAIHRDFKRTVSRENQTKGKPVEIGSAPYTKEVQDNLSLCRKFRQVSGIF